MLNQTPSSPAPSRFSLKKLPWGVFGFVLLVHLCVLWWLLGAYFGRVPDDSDPAQQPIFVTLEVGEPEPETSPPQPADTPNTANQSQSEANQTLETPVDLVLDQAVKQLVAPSVVPGAKPDSKQKENRVSTPPAPSPPSASPSAPSSSAPSSSAPSPVASSQPTQLADSGPRRDPGPRLVTRVQYLGEPPRPAYPAFSKSRKQQGKVIVRLLISPDGLISTIRIQQSSGFDALDEAAIRAFADIRFKPYSENGVPYERQADIPIEFTLRN